MPFEYLKYAGIIIYGLNIYGLWLACILAIRKQKELPKKALFGNFNLGWILSILAVVGYLGLVTYYYGHLRADDFVTILVINFILWSMIGGFWSIIGGVLGDNTAAEHFDDRNKLLKAAGGSREKALEMSRKENLRTRNILIYSLSLGCILSFSGIMMEFIHTVNGVFALILSASLPPSYFLLSWAKDENVTATTYSSGGSRSPRSERAYADFFQQDFGVGGAFGDW
ncbi:MAG: hypothetical protein MRZ79_23475 [Bacteroidia bacterium]|nr:hypothetical protein [Bacteroidia bacterium]